MGATALALGASPAASAADVLSPPGEAVSHDANPSQTGVASEDAVFGPLAVAWTKSFPGPPNQVLAADGRVLLNVAKSNGSGGYGSTVRALDPATGAQQWSASHDHVYFTSRIATDAGVVVAQGPSYDGVLRAFDTDTGALLWEYVHEGYAGGTVVAADGVAYVSQGASTVGRGWVLAFRLSDGTLLWRSGETGVDGDDRAAIALGETHVFLADECGRAAAVSRATGTITWARPSLGTCFAEDAVVSDGVVYAGEGHTYGAVNGTPGVSVADAPGAVTDSVGLAATWSFYDIAVTSFPLAGGQPFWTSPFGESVDPIEPLVVGGTAYMARNYYFDHSSELIGWGPRSGDVLLRMDIPYPEYIQVGGTKPGLTAAEGRLFVSQGMMLTALEPLLKPPPRGVDLLVSPTDVLAKSPVRLWAGLGKEVREEGRRVTFRGDEFPHGSFDHERIEVTLEDGVARTSFSLNRNTRFRAETSDATSREFTAYAYPDVRLRLIHDGPRSVKARTTVGLIPNDALQDRKVFAYYGHGGRRFVRKAASRLRTRRDQPALTTSIVRLPEGSGNDDVIVVCVNRLPEDGWGRDIGLAGRCGEREVILDPVRVGERKGPSKRPLGVARERVRG